ncbi:hypothetical protein [Alteromonas lipotrueae]|uniref:hypothetical protein n=1 Tax=Alteromonas lipotrueae TaxID=2803814 RepID=UPI001C44860B|nr:hypothetical protein [Alteromonas lipotrueae]
MQIIKLLGTALTVSFICSANCLANGDDNAPMLIGYVGHPRVVTHYNNIIARTYSKLGITVEFIEVGGERGLRLLDAGVTDADTVRYELATNDFSNFFVVRPVIVKGATILLCMRNSLCENSVLSNPNIVIAATKRFHINIEESDIDIAANLREYDRFDQVVNLLVSGRYNYALLPTDFSDEATFKKLGARHLVIVEHNIVHVVNNKYLHLREDLSEALSSVLKEVNSIEASN